MLYYLCYEIHQPITSHITITIPLGINSAEYPIR